MEVVLLIVLVVALVVIIGAGAAIVRSRRRDVTVLEPPPDAPADTAPRAGARDRAGRWRRRRGSGARAGGARRGGGHRGGGRGDRRRGRGGPRRGPCGRGGRPAPLPRPARQGPQRARRLRRLARSAGRRSTPRRGTSSRRRSSAPTSGWRPPRTCSTTSGRRVAAEGLTDGTQLVEALKEELKGRLSGYDLDLHLADEGPTVWLFVGVNGVGKTTTIGKLGRREADAGHQGRDGGGRHVPGRRGRAARHVGRAIGGRAGAGQRGRRPERGHLRRGRRRRRPRGRPGPRRHRRSAPHQGQPDGGAPQGAPGRRQGRRAPSPRCSWCSTPPPARTAWSRPSSSPRPSISRASCSPSSTARPRAASSSPSTIPARHPREARGPRRRRRGPRALRPRRVRGGPVRMKLLTAPHPAAAPARAAPREAAAGDRRAHLPHRLQGRHPAGEGRGACRLRTLGLKALVLFALGVVVGVVDRPSPRRPARRARRASVAGLRPRSRDRSLRRAPGRPASTRRAERARRRRSTEALGETPGESVAPTPRTPMFEALSDRFEGVLGRLRGKGKLTEDDVDEALREIRLALLEADVNFTVVKNFVGARPRAVPRRGALRGAEPRPAGRQDRQRGAHRHPRRRDDPHHLQRQAAHRRADGRPPGLGQDHQLGQAGPLVQEPGPPPAARRRRPPAAGGGRAAPHPRPPDRGPGLLRGRATRWPWPRPASPRPGAPAATWSSSTPPAASPSTRS